MADRWIPLAGNDNARDLGGLPLTGGGETRSGVLLRSDTVQELTPADVRLLVDTYGLRTVVDLRTPLEAEREGRGLLAAEPVGYHNFTFVPDEYVVIDDPEHALIVAERRGEDRVTHYLEYLRGAGGAVVAALRVLAGGDTAPVLFHCAAGKDRTGVLAALVLEIVGVERAAVVADYALTNERLPGVVARLNRLPSYDLDRLPAAVRDITADPATMRDVLAALDRGYGTGGAGGAAGWARRYGLSDDEQGRLRDLLRT